MVIFVDVARTYEDERTIEFRFDSNYGSGWLVHDKANERTELIAHRESATGASAASNGFQ